MRQLSTKFIFTVFINAPVCRSHFSWLFTETHNQLIGTGKVSNVIVKTHSGSDLIRLDSVQCRFL